MPGLLNLILLMHAIWCPSDPRSFQGMCWKPHPPAFEQFPLPPIYLPAAADSINQFCAPAAERQAIMEHRPGALELALHWGLGDFQTDSGCGRGEQKGPGKDWLT